jgi:hypothetical protein
MKPVVFIHTNEKQMLGALVSQHALKLNSKNPDKFDVKILSLEETPHLYSREGRTYLRKGKVATWRNSDLQSFSPLRMMVPQVMGYKGKALVIDPDIFAVGDVLELIERDMNESAVICKHIQDGYKGNGNAFFATSVMLLNCEKLSHWQWDQQIDDMFNQKLDYGDWISLRFEDPSRIGILEEEWNHFDTLNEQTRLLHNTERITQPWKTGLPIDFDTTVKPKTGKFATYIQRFTNSFFKRDGKAIYQPHPDKNQEKLFLSLLKDCLDKGIIQKELLAAHVEANNVRKDIFSVLDKI